MNKTLINLFACLLIMNSTWGQVSTAKQSLYFDLGKSDLSDLHQAQLDSVLMFVGSTDHFKIGIKGYACSIGTPEKNRRISNQRALNVYTYLASNGIKKDSLFYAGLGIQDPLGDNTTDAGRKRNRRTDVEITFKYTAKTQPIVKETPVTIAPPVYKTETAKFGPDATSANIKKENINIIESSNCMTLLIPDSTFNTLGNELLEVNIKDLTKNYDFIKKSMHTFSGKGYLATLGAIQVDVTLGTEMVRPRDGRPMILSVPGAYDPAMKLYRNSRNWELDTMDRLTYDNTKQAYLVSIYNVGELLSIAKKIDSPKLILVKIKASDKTKIKPYVIHDNCLVSTGRLVKGKWYSLPYINKTGLVRGYYQDFSSTSPKTYSLKEDISYTDANISAKKLLGLSFWKLSSPSSIEYKLGELEKSNLCETPCR